MRIHRLRVQAFGPFAGVEEVDVDALAAPGVFLLHGPTGAGKTSVLDAVCYALYGGVPGARRAAPAARLRSDHAPPDLAAEVTAEISVGGRRFAVTRRPEHVRSRRRGSGTTTDPATTLLIELVDGRWVSRSSRNDEASQLLTDVLGMGLEQFVKVVLLPQGDFAAFLRSPDAGRGEVLQRLFDTGRFLDVETWLREQRRALTAAVDAADAGVGRLLARAAEAASAVLPGAATGDEAPVGRPPTQSSLVAATEDAVVHVERLLAAATVAHDVRTRAGDEAAAARDDARAASAAASADAERATRVARALSGRAALLADAVRVADVASELSRARAAAAVTGHLESAGLTHGRLSRAAAALLSAEQAVDASEHGGPESALDDDALAWRVRALREDVLRLEDLALVESELAGRRRRVHELRRSVAEQRRLVAVEDDAARERARERDGLLVGRPALVDTATPAAARDAAAEAAEAVHRRAVEAVGLGHQLARARERADARTRAALAAREDWLDVREARLAGMAAELAASLTVDGPCPVCGSREHPAPAPADPTRVTAEDEEAGRTRSDLAESDRDAAARDVVALAVRYDAAQAGAGGRDADDCAAALAEARRRAGQARRATEALVSVDARLRALADLDIESAAGRALAREKEAAGGAELRVAEGEARRLATRVDDARGDHPTLAHRRSQTAATAEVLDALLRARTAAAGARDAVAAADAAATAAAARAGFRGTDAARAAVRTLEVVAGLQRTVDTHASALAAVTAQLDADGATDLGSDPSTASRSAAAARVAAVAAEVAAARRREELADADTDADATRTALAVADRSARSLRDCLDQVAADVAATGPLRRRLEVLTEVSGCVDGTGPGNALRMRLSSFVLAARLEQVAAAASTRLLATSGGRYSLVHSDAPARHGARSGLGLRVVDAWTGSERETGSLSGGETFLASLALALGLADVVQAEAGGTAIETLFVDEGFGTLDEEALEEVMAVLDGLREGGRVVGLVSHVAELQQRVTSRLEVVKGRQGSTLVSHTASSAPASVGGTAA